MYVSDNIKLPTTNKQLKFPMEERPHFEEKIPVHFHWHFMDSQTSFIIEIPEKMLSLRMI